MSSDSEEEAVALTSVMLLLNEMDKTLRMPAIKKREQESNLICNLLKELRQDENRFKENLTMGPAMFEELLKLITPSIKKLDNKLGKIISPEEKLFITLRFLATGATYSTLHSEFGLGFTTIQNFIPEVCHTIWKTLSPIYLRQRKLSDWFGISERFKKLWQFPNCIGSIECRRIRVKCPRKGATANIALQAVVDADGNFISIEFTDNGKLKDREIFFNSKFGRKSITGRLRLPRMRTIAKNNLYKLPYVLVGDEAYPLRRYLMRPYSKPSSKADEIFNYRVRRAHRLAGCAFTLLTKKFTILTKFLQPYCARTVIMASCVLHNFIRSKEGRLFEIYEDLRGLNVPVSDTNKKREQWTLRAERVRKEFVKYFNSSKGSVPWQNKFNIL